MTAELLKVKKITKHFPLRQGFLDGRRDIIRAVEGINLNILEGETLGLVGESGCGKSTLGRLIVRLLSPTAGSIEYEGKDVSHLKGRSLQEYRRQVQIIFQDPCSSLNPRRKAGDIISEPLIIHRILEDHDRRKIMHDLIGLVGLTEEQLSRYPHEFSGGQRQRIGIARALILRPKLIVADEPVSSLDVSIQAQILNLLKELQKEFTLTYLFITHDLSVVRYMSDRVAVMYLGKIVELARNDELFQKPLHPYTRLLLSTVPLPYPGRKKERIALAAEMSSPLDDRTGCSFRPRCQQALSICSIETPSLRERGDGQSVACHLYNA